VAVVQYSTVQYSTVRYGTVRYSRDKLDTTCFHTVVVVGDRMKQRAANWPQLLRCAHISKLVALRSIFVTPDIRSAPVSAAVQPALTDVSRRLSRLFNDAVHF